MVLFMTSIESSVENAAAIPGGTQSAIVLAMIESSYC